jgi:hypothetical protein
VTRVRDAKPKIIFNFHFLCYKNVCFEIMNWKYKFMNITFILTLNDDILVTLNDLILTSTNLVISLVHHVKISYRYKISYIPEN